MRTCEFEFPSQTGKGIHRTFSTGQDAFQVSSMLIRVFGSGKQDRTAPNVRFARRYLVQEMVIHGWLVIFSGGIPFFGPVFVIYSRRISGPGSVKKLKLAENLPYQNFPVASLGSRNPRKTGQPESRSHASSTIKDSPLACRRAAACIPLRPAPMMISVISRSIVVRLPVSFSAG